MQKVEQELSAVDCKDVEEALGVKIYTLFYESTEIIWVYGCYCAVFKESL